MNKIIYVLMGMLLGVMIMALIEFKSYQTGYANGEVNTMNTIFRTIVFPK